MWNQDKYIQAWNFACKAHNGQSIPGSDIPYINHISNVAMEVISAIAQSKSIQKPDLAVQCALLHDTIEDTEITYETIETEFGKAVASGVLALTKNSQFKTKEEKMQDSLTRIKEQPEEVWMVKLADRITNLQPPPSHWKKDKIVKYKAEASVILQSLGKANTILANRLNTKIEFYNRFC
ncbi:MAG: HD domain-containing protein [Leptospirales bacterium]